MPMPINNSIAAKTPGRRVRWCCPLQEHPAGEVEERCTESDDRQEINAVANAGARPSTTQRSRCHSSTRSTAMRGGRGEPEMVETRAHRERADADTGLQQSGTRVAEVELVAGEHDHDEVDRTNEGEMAARHGEHAAGVTTGTEGPARCAGQGSEPGRPSSAVIRVTLHGGPIDASLPNREMIVLANESTAPPASTNAGALHEPATRSTNE